VHDAAQTPLTEEEIRASAVGQILARALAAGGDDEVAGASAERAL
jgi:hypothetical protein